MVEIKLPWPDSRLSQNARIHWSKRAALTKDHRSTARLLTLAALGRSKVIESKLRLNVTFYPPDRRRRDKSNCIAMFKAYEDGLSDAIGIDDSNFRTSYEMGGPVKGGYVVVVAGGGNEEDHVFRGHVVANLRLGYGAEDMAVKTGYDVTDIRDEIESLRQTGLLAEIYKDT